MENTLRINFELSAKNLSQPLPSGSGFLSMTTGLNLIKQASPPLSLFFPIKK